MCELKREELVTRGPGDTASWKTNQGRFKSSENTPLRRIETVWAYCRSALVI